jgi:MotA/TolQ/ExbB proton channel family
MQAGSEDWGSVAGNVSSASPEGAQLELHSEWSMSLAGMLVMACAIGVIFFFLRGLHRRNDIWEPLWLGFLALAVGLAGTVAETIAVLCRMASLGDVVNLGDITAGTARALITSFMGLNVMAGAIFCSLILWRRRPKMTEGVPKERQEEREPVS